jgi:hypothetical protein
MGKTMIRRLGSPALCLLITATPGLAHDVGRFDPAPCEPGQLQVMVLGTYHMADPGMDAVNMEADDVLSARRQTEIADLVDRLARFAPNKVMLESAFGSSTVQERYTAYLNGDRELTRNEIDQIGYRLARRLGHSEVYPVDYPMFQDGTALEFYQAHHPASKDDGAEIRARWQAAAEADTERLRSSTVAEYLGHLNSVDWWAFDLDNRYALQTSIRYAQYDQYAGADLLTSWYKRNLRILTNIHRSTGDDDERVLLLIGAGHNRILWDLIDTSPLLCRVDPRPFLKN